MIKKYSIIRIYEMCQDLLLLKCDDVYKNFLYIFFFTDDTKRWLYNKINYE